MEKLKSPSILLLRVASSIILILSYLSMQGQFVGDSLYQHEQLNEGKSLEESEWNQIIENTSFDEEKLEQKKEEEVKEEEKVTFNSNWWESLGPIIKVIAILFLVIIVGYIIYLLTRVETNKKFKLETALHKKLELIEEDLMESELEQFLSKAIEAKDYRLAIRIYFLMMIQKLTELKRIDYKKEKTNFSYLLEMKSNQRFEEFRNLTYAFEYAWYGGVSPDEKMFSVLRLRFDSFLNALDHE